MTTRTLLALAAALSLAGCRTRDAEVERELDGLEASHRELCTPARDTLAACVHGAALLRRYGREVAR